MWKSDLAVPSEVLPRASAQLSTQQCASAFRSSVSDDGIKATIVTCLLRRKVSVLANLDSGNFKRRFHTLAGD